MTPKCCELIDNRKIDVAARIGSKIKYWAVNRAYDYLINDISRVIGPIRYKILNDRLSTMAPNGFVSVLQNKITKVMRNK